MDNTPFNDAAGNRIGIVSFSTDVILECPLRYKPDVIRKRTDDINYLGGRTNTAEAIQVAGQELEKSSSADRYRIIEGMLGL